MTTAAIDERLGTDPAVAVAIRELVDARYLVAPDAEMVELTARGFGAIQAGNSRASLGGATDCFQEYRIPSTDGAFASAKLKPHQSSKRIFGYWNVSGSNS